MQFKSSTWPTHANIMPNNPRYLAEYSYVKFSLSNNIESVYDGMAHITRFIVLLTIIADYSFLYNIQYSPYTCTLAGCAGYMTNGICKPNRSAVNVCIVWSVTSLDSFSLCVATFVKGSLNLCSLSRSLRLWTSCFAVRDDCVHFDSRFIQSYFCEYDSTCSDLSQCTKTKIDIADGECKLGDLLDKVVGGVDRSQIVECMAPTH